MKARYLGLSKRYRQRRLASELRDCIGSKVEGGGVVPERRRWEAAEVIHSLVCIGPRKGKRDLDGSRAKAVEAPTKRPPGHTCRSAHA